MSQQAYSRRTMASYTPKPEHKFTFGLWTIGNTGRDTWGNQVRDALAPDKIVRLLGEVGAYGVNFHDNDLIPIDATPAETAQIKKRFRKALNDTGLVVPMATTNLFSDPIFRDGAFTSNNHKVRSYALQKTMHAIDLGVEFGAKTYVFWGGREGTDTDAGKSALESGKRFREALNYLCEYVVDQGYDLKFALEAKPNEPRGDLFLPVTGSMLGFIGTLDRPDMVGVNPEVAHEQMAGLNFSHALAEAWGAGKLFHVDLNDQNFARFDQDFRFGSHNIKQCFFVVKFLEDVGYDASRHFDAHAYRSSDIDDVKAFARGNMRTYLVLKEKAAQFNADKEIQALLKEINADDGSTAKYTGKYSSAKAKALKAARFNRPALGARGLPYERLDQLTVDLLLGVRG
jgi:xylose isomerase